MQPKPDYQAAPRSHHGLEPPLEWPYQLLQSLLAAEGAHAQETGELKRSERALDPLVAALRVAE